MAFEARTRFRVELVEGGMGGLRLVEEAITPFVKDYDAIPGESPMQWADRWDLSTWGILAAMEGAELIGGAAVAPNVPEVRLAGGRDDAAVLWDFRVRPNWRGQGVGKSLFEAAEEWAREQGFRLLLVETQNVNVAACRYYARMGCELASIDRLAYPSEMNEVELIWSKRL